MENNRCPLCGSHPDGNNPDYPHVTIVMPQAMCQRSICPMRVPFSNRTPLTDVRGWFGGKQDK